MLYSRKTSWFTKLMGLALIMNVGTISANLPTVVTDSNGNQVALFGAMVNNYMCINAVTKASGASSWSQPVVISPAAMNSSAASIAMDSTGNSVAVWVSSGALPQLFSAQLPAGGNWSVPFAISPPTQRVYPDFTLAINARGDVTVIWQATDPTGGTTNVFTAELVTGGSWSAPVALDAP
jgi:hypothetical protein